jgi:hypothetical protein
MPLQPEACTIDLQGLMRILEHLEATATFANGNAHHLTHRTILNFASVEGAAEAGAASAGVVGDRVRERDLDLEAGEVAAVVHEPTPSLPSADEANSSSCAEDGGSSPPESLDSDKSFQALCFFRSKQGDISELTAHFKPLEPKWLQNVSHLLKMGPSKQEAHETLGLGGVTPAPKTPADGGLPPLHTPNPTRSA